MTLFRKGETMLLFLFVGMFFILGSVLRAASPNGHPFKPELSFALGKVREGPESGTILEVSEEELSEHMTVLGRTGSGKSRFLEGFIREHLEMRRGCIVIDPDGDLTENILGYCARMVIDSGNKKIFQRVHYLAPSPFLTFAYDPFHFFLPKPVRPELIVSARRAWLHARVQRFADVLQRKQGQADFEGMPRLQRVLTNVLTAVGTLVDGRRLPLGDAEILD